MWRTARSVPRKAASRAAICSAIWFDAELAWWATATVMVDLLGWGCWWSFVCAGRRSADGGATYGLGHGTGDAGVEDARDDVAGVELVRRHLVSDGLRGRGEH